MTVFSKLCVGFSALTVTSGLHIAPSGGAVSKGAASNAHVSSVVKQKSINLKNAGSRKIKKSHHKRADGDEAGDVENWSGEDYATDSEEEFPAEAEAPKGSAPAPPPLTTSGPLVVTWDVHDLNCAYGVFTHACPSTHFCYKNFASVEVEPAQCEEKRLPHTACGVFDQRFWPVVCDSEVKSDGVEQRYSCQEMKPEGAVEPEEPEEEAVADEGDLFFGAKEGMCEPCCDREVYTDDAAADKACGAGDARTPDCPHNYELSGVDMKMVETTTQICIKGAAGDTLKACPSGPVKLEAEVDVCVTIEDFAKETKNPELKNVVEQPIPASLEAELHEEMQKMALKKADVCKPPPPPPKPKAKPSAAEGKAEPKAKAKGKAGAKAEPKAKAKAGAKAEAKAAPKAKAAAGDADAAAAKATAKMNRAPTADEPVPDTTSPTEADAANADSQALSAGFVLSKAKKAGGAKTAEKVVAQKEKVVARSASEIKESWNKKAMTSTDKSHDTHVQKAKEAVKKVVEIVKKPQAAAAKEAVPAPKKVETVKKAEEKKPVKK